MNVVATSEWIVVDELATEVDSGLLGSMKIDSKAIENDDEMFGNTVCVMD